ncbi:hypothetical protein A2U01_0101313, partial [Trifolium medium]|nr:hypothetical protein [Trifolium medium]
MIATPSTKVEIQATTVNEEEDWRTPLLDFILHDKLPGNKEEATKLRGESQP